VGELRGDEPSEERLVPDPAEREGVQSLDPGRPELLGGGAQLVALDGAGGGDAIGDEQDAPLAARPRVIGGPGERLLEVRGRRAGLSLTNAPELGLAERAGLAVEDRARRLIEARDGERCLRTGEGREPLCEALHELDLLGEAERPRRAGVEEDERRAKGLGLGLRRDPHPRGHEVAAAEPDRAPAARVEAEVGVRHEPGARELTERLRIAGARHGDVELAEAPAGRGAGSRTASPA